MSTAPVSIHPYFKVQPGKLPAAKEVLSKFIQRTQTEEAVLNYEFTIHEDTVFCRESYRDAAAALAHLSNVGEILAEMLQVSELIRLELHGPAEELAKLKEPLASLDVSYFTWECGFVR